MANVVHLLRLRIFDNFLTGKGLEKNDISVWFEYEVFGLPKIGETGS
jgi:hypothetical protein